MWIAGSEKGTQLAATKGGGCAKARSMRKCDVYSWPAAWFKRRCRLVASDCVLECTAPAGKAHGESRMLPLPPGECQRYLLDRAVKLHTSISSRLMPLKPLASSAATSCARCSVAW